MTETPAPAALQRTPLHRLHVELNARMVPFAGYEMPVQYSRGILKEHLHVRAAAGLFDVSHMGQFAVRARSGHGEDAASALESVVPMNLVGLAAGRQRYALLTNDAGGIRDDLMIANLGDRFLIVANAACKHADEAYLRQMLSARCEIERLDERALLALQGPLAEMALAPLMPDVTAMHFMDVRAVTLVLSENSIRSGFAS
jgi:glycine cleavage system T protein (aminomethyltransferase)